VVQVTHDEDDISPNGQVLPMAGWQ